MNKRIFLLVVFCVTATIGACSRAKDAVIPADPAKWSSLGDVTKDLSAEDKRLLGTYLMRKSFAGALAQGNGIPPGTTVGEAIDDQRNFEAKEKLADAQAAALRARALAERNAVIDKLNKLVTFAVVSKTYVPKDFQAERFSDRVAFVFAVKNNGTRDIAGIKGVVEFDDMFGTPIEKMGLSLDNAIPANSEKTIDGYSKDLNQFEANDQQLAVTDLSKIKVKFEPQMIVFSDGSNIKAPDTE